MTTQTKQEHTPGPWEMSNVIVNENEYSVAIAAYVDGEHLNMLHSRRCRIADTYGKNICEANARLIATSPSLLEACKAARDMIRHDYHEHHVEICEKLGLTAAINAVEGKG